MRTAVLRFGDGTTNASKIAHLRRAYRKIEGGIHAKASVAMSHAQGALQAGAQTAQRVTSLEALVARGFWGRLKWLFSGR
jgi:hypothetical protein